MLPRCFGLSDRPVFSYLPDYKGLLGRPRMALDLEMAERAGFEPAIGINLYTLSRRAP